jgi:hypothetical protein
MVGSPESPVDITGETQKSCKSEAISLFFAGWVERSETVDPGFLLLGRAQPNLGPFNCEVGCGESRSDEPHQSRTMRFASLTASYGRVPGRM